MLTEMVTRLRATTTTDPYSNEDSPDWSTPSELNIVTLAPAEPRPSQEPVQDARNAVTSGFTLYLPEDADVTARDRMRVRGRVYDVLGDPAGWLGAGLVVQVGATEG
jgi:head-tail adaptor